MEPGGELPGPWESMPCYVANASLESSSDDGLCEHCGKFLTTECIHIAEFLGEDE